MPHPAPSKIPLSSLAIGADARIVEIDGGRQLIRRLLSLGLRVGSEVRILHRRGRGVVLFNAQNRVALGAGIAAKILMEPLATTETSVAKVPTK